MEEPASPPSGGEKGSASPRAHGPGPAVQRLLEQSQASAGEVAAQPAAGSRNTRLRWSLLLADVLLVLLGAALLNGVPLMAVFWMEWTLAVLAFSLGGWLAWLSLSL